MKNLLLASIALFIFLPSIALSQNLNEAKIVGQPLVYLKNGKIHGCGVRLFAFQLNPEASTGTGWDVSFNLWRDGLATAKGLVYDIDVQEMRAGKKPKTARLEKFWIKAPGKSATQPRDKKIIPGEDEGSILYAMEFDTAMDLARATLQKESLTIGVQRPGERTERLYFGTPSMSDAERGQLINCMSEASR